MNESNSASPVRIVTDSTADLPASLVEELGITVVPLQVSFGDESYRDGVDIKPDQFYKQAGQLAGAARTSQPSVGAFEAAYERIYAETDSILSIHISSALSGTYGSALLARDSLRNRCNIEVLDSRLASLGARNCRDEVRAAGARGNGPPRADALRQADDPERSPDRSWSRRWSISRRAGGSVERRRFSAAYSTSSPCSRSRRARSDRSRR